MNSWMWGSVAYCLFVAMVVRFVGMNKTDYEED